MEYDNTLDKLSKKSVIVKGNPLIQARFDDLSAVEYKIIITALSKIQPSDKLLDYITFEVKDFCKLLKIQKKGMYSYLRESCDKLIKRTITIEKGKNYWEKFSWLHKIIYRNGIITLKFHSDLEPYIIFCLENKSYTKYFLENVIDMERKYSMRIYELTKQYEKIGTRTFKIDELKLYLGIPSTKYKKITHFRRDVLNPSKEEINGLTDINISFEELKEGRSVKEIKYYIKTKNYNMNTTEYSLLPKLKLITIIRKNIYELTGIVLDFKLLNNYHRIVLIELIKKFDSKIFSKVIIKYPKPFFTWHLEDINKMYDLSNIKDF